MSSSGITIKPKESPDSTEEANKPLVGTASATPATPSNNGSGSGGSQKKLSTVPLTEASQLSVANKNQSGSAEIPPGAESSLLELKRPSQKSGSVADQQVGSGAGTAENHVTKEQNGAMESSPLPITQAAQAERLPSLNQGVYPSPWSSTFTYQCQPVPQPTAMVCYAAPLGANPTMPQNFNPSMDPRGSAWASAETTGMKDQGRAMNPSQFPQFGQPQSLNEELRRKIFSPSPRPNGPTLMPNNCFSSPYENPSQFPNQNALSTANQPPSPFMIQCQCQGPGLVSNPANLTCGPGQGATQYDYQGHGGMQGQYYPTQSSLASQQNALQQQMQWAQHAAQGQNQFNGFIGKTCAGYGYSGCSPVPGPSTPFGPFPADIQQNIMPTTSMCSQWDGQQQFMSSANNYMNQCNNYCPDDMQKCMTLPCCTSNQKEQECSQPRQITLVREVYHFKKLPRKSSRKKCCLATSNASCRPPWAKNYKSCKCNQEIVAVAPFRNNVCSPPGQASRMDFENCPGMCTCKYSSCFCPWKSNSKICSGNRGNAVYVKQKGQGQSISSVKSRGYIGPTSLVREFYVRGQPSIQDQRRTSPHYQNSIPPEAVDPEVETGFEVSNRGLSTYFSGNQKKLSRRMSKPIDPPEDTNFRPSQDTNHK